MIAGGFYQLATTDLNMVRDGIIQMNNAFAS
ncbi:hypothetical protein C8N30_1042 [Sulfitobacter guttiformis]|uniref:Uncharacterized protein n=2 Tax=Sulfitobacter guttiformis TaxID=74349 RepID=A0A420DQ95_9RHOB|nr:hypothetical protein C8N30_1042 [Sulfitobacter guttiformis]